MSIATQLSRLTTLRNNIRTKLISLGIISNSSANLQACYNGLNAVTAKNATTYNTSSSDQTISSGQYLTGAQTIKAVTISGISVGNIKSGVTVKVGDANDDDRIAGVTGTFTSSSTVSSGQIAASAGQILSGYSAWVNGAEVQGTAPDANNALLYSEQTLTESQVEQVFENLGIGSAATLDYSILS